MDSITSINLYILKDEKDNKNFKHIKQGIAELNEIFASYNYDFIIEEMFRDLKSNGFDMEGTWTEDIIYFKNLYLCLSIAYRWMIILGADCSKNKKSKIVGTTKKLKNKIVRVYSLFRCGIKWFNRCYDSDTKKYRFKFEFILYDI